MIFEGDRKPINPLSKDIYPWSIKYCKIEKNNTFDFGTIVFKIKVKSIKLSGMKNNIDFSNDRKDGIIITPKNNKFQIFKK